MRATRLRAENRRLARVQRQMVTAEALAADHPAHPGCRVADTIVHCDEVEVGDLMLTSGVLASVEAIKADLSQPDCVCIAVQHAALGEHPVFLWRQRHLLAAVRRYQEG